MINHNEIFRCNDEHGTIIVYEYKKFRIMTFDSPFEQSKACMGNPLYIDHEYMQAMLLPLLQVTPAHVTILGLGAGTAASCLYYAYLDTRVVAVEWRQAVIDIAYRYFDLPEDNRLEVRHCDAMSWLEQCADQSTDLLLSDLYHAYAMNDIQFDKTFFDHCHRVLSSEGWLTLNYHKMPSAESLTVNHLCQLFPSVFMVRVNTDNWVVVASKQETTLQAMSLMPLNNILPASLVSHLEQLQVRLVKVNRKKKKLYCV
jgi:spermidine synthase